MSQMADITVFDGASTPVSHTLKAVEIQNLPNGSVEATYREENVAIPYEAQITCVIRKKKLASGVVEAEIRVSTPVMETVTDANAQGYTAAPKVAYVDTDIFKKLIHPRSTITTRRTSRMLAVNIANNVTTSVAAGTAGPGCELLDNVRMPT